VIDDQREAALVESGDVIAAGRVFAELGEVVAGIQPGRSGDDEITIFKSVGVAVEDIVSADLVYRKAVANGQKRPPSG
jgi:ornithine cyclodeaminase/alanine dehydrogenase-like protein (mu-crystallin family)